MKTALLLQALLASSRAPALCALTAEQEAYRQTGVENLFNLDFVESRAEMRKLIATDPQSPFGYLFESGIIWWQAAAEYGLFKDTPTLQGLFETDIDNALALSSRLMDSHDDAQKADGYFVAGMTLGCRGQWNLYRRHYLQAYRDGKKAIKFLKRCVKLDPNYTDAYLGLGIFDYQIARYGGFLKLGALFMPRGDVERGKSRIREAAEKGRLVPRQAAAFLLSLLILDERDYPGASKLLRQLREAYPASPYYHFIEVMLLHQLNDWEGSYRSASALFQQTAQDPEILQRKQLSMLCGLSGARCLDERAIQAALGWLDRAVPAAEREAAEEESRREAARRKARRKGETVSISTGPAPGAWPAILHLYRGISHDVLHQHALAVEDYQKVLGGLDAGRAKAQAKHCLDYGCDKDETLRMLKELALANEEASPPPSVLRHGEAPEPKEPD